MAYLYKCLSVFLFLLFVSCSSADSLIDQYSEDYTNKYDNNNIGTLNAVKKAYQLTDVTFTPLCPIEANSKVYNEGGTYKGMIYSSVKEIGTYVGSNVSFHTFMTAIHNPRSKIYTERLNALPYHGTNCKAYYGTVCSGLVSYALGLNYASYDFPVSELMEEVDYSNIDNIRVADVLWKSGHVAMITNVLRNSEGHVMEVEISEAVQTGCRRYMVTSAKFMSLMSKSFKALYRYKELYKNVDYTPAPEFVAVLDEVPILYNYNENLCADKGDQACYLEDETVIVNVFCDYDFLDVYKDDIFYMRVDSSEGKDIKLENLPYGDYKANICYGDMHVMSDFANWKVVNIELRPDRSNGRLYFKSANAIPFKLSFANLSGNRTYPHTELFCHRVTDDERIRGYLEIPMELTKKKYPFIHFCFSTEYGIIESRPINWFE